MVTARALLAAVFALGCGAIPTRAPDAGPACEVGTPCGGACRDLLRDDAHCGACGRACGVGARCDEGVCAPRVVALSAGEQHTCALAEGGAVWCWGRNESAQVGAAEAVSVPRPSRVQELPPARAIAAGDDYTCAVTEAEGDVWCWGSNSEGCCDVASAQPVCRRPVRIARITGVEVLCTGYFAACATTAGAVRCWGSDAWGGLGDGRSGGARPTTVDLDGVTHLGCGWGHVCARRDDGAVWCWGARSDGQVGDGVVGPLTAVSTRPALVRDLEDAVGIASTTGSTCAWNARGAVRCWGTNDAGQLGDGTTGRRWFPETQAIAEGAEELSCSGQNCFARMTDGRLLGWGRGAEGNLGLAEPLDVTRPTPVFTGLGARVRTAVAGASHTCALLEDGRVRCVGDGRYGQRGEGRTGVRGVTPVRPAWDL